MSTKIYYGFQVATSDPKVILNLVQEYREKYWVSDARGKKVLFLSSVVAGATDPDKKFMSEEFGYEMNAYSLAENMWNKMRSELMRTGLRNHAVDTDFQIVVFPYQDKFLGIVYTENGKWFKQWLSMPGVSEYGYWNNTDQPDNISDEEWEVRSEVWDEVLGDLGIPSMVGFTIDIHDPFGPGFIKKEEFLTKDGVNDSIKKLYNEDEDDDSN
jgi:hypothetical protein